MARSLLLDRRRWLALSAAGSLAGAGWLNGLAAAAAANPARHRSVIMLWLSGGPSTIDLWDLKPHHVNGGPFRPRQTSVPGIQISEHLPRLARHMEQITVIRSMTGGEGDHTRATHLLRTGYTPAGAIRFPALGALVSHEFADEEADLPSFVSITPSTRLAEIGNGFLSPEHAPFAIEPDEENDGELSVRGLRRPDDVSKENLARRLALRNQLDREFARRHEGRVVASLQSAARRAARLMQPAAASVFDLDREEPRLRERYGQDSFGQGCLLARRLVERGVPFVEVTLDGWDTHRNNFPQVERLAGQLDRSFSALLTDLKQRGLLDSTLIVCQGEFGRTPAINRNQGRDHWPAAWSAVLAGGGIAGGQVVGRTSDDGMEVVERPATAADLVATVCQVVGLDPRKQNMSNVGRPIRVAPREAEVLEEVLRS